jgi:large subunit ribosomal protein L29
MKKADLSQTSTTDLQEKLKEERNALDKMFFTHAISPVENPMRIPLTKKSIARTMTELRKRELAEIKK